MKETLGVLSVFFGIFMIIGIFIDVSHGVSMSFLSILGAIAIIGIAVWVTISFIKQFKE